MRGVLALLGAAGVLSGACMAAAGVAGHRLEPPREALRRALSLLLLVAPVGDGAGLRLAGVTARTYNAQRIGGSLAGLASGATVGAMTQNGRLPAVLVGLVAGCVGWVLPMMGARDAARRARGEFDEVIRVWIALTAQQVRAGAEPAAAMLDAARAGRRPVWELLRRSLLAAQQQGRPAWEGLAGLVERYGLRTVAPTISALGLAEQRGTRVADAVLAAADTLWQESVARERERAVKRSQLVVLPATGVALGLAAILVYPPFTALTGGGLVGG